MGYCATIMDKKIIFYIIAIIAVLGVVYAGQQAYFRTLGANFMSDAGDKAGAYLSKGSGWVSDWVASKMGGGELIKNKVDETEKIQNYFSGVGESILGKENSNCQSCSASAGQ